MMAPAKQKRLLKRFGSCPAGYTHQDLEQFLDLLYGMYRPVYWRGTAPDDRE